MRAIRRALRWLRDQFGGPPTGDADAATVMAACAATDAALAATAAACVIVVDA